MIRQALLALMGFATLAMPVDLEAQKRQRDRITKQEIEASPHREMDLHQVIRSIRPHFLEPPKGVRSMGGSMANYTPIALYVDGRKETGLDALRTMNAMMVEEVRYYEPSQAENEFGPSAANGAVVVKMRKSPKEGETKPPKGAR